MARASQACSLQIIPNSDSIKLYGINHMSYEICMLDRSNSRVTENCHRELESLAVRHT